MSTPHPEVDQHGRKTYSGEGGGYLAFPAHSSRPSIGVVRFRDAIKHEHELAIVGSPLTSNDEDVTARFSDAVIEALDNHAAVAITLLEALRDKRVGYFETLAKAMRAGEVSRPEAKTEEEKILRWAIVEAAEKAGGVPPTREQVTEVFENCTKTDGKGGAKVRSDKMQAKLESIGFGWLEHRSRGDTLRRD